MAINFVSRISLDVGLSYHIFKPGISFLPKTNSSDLNAETNAVLRNDTLYPEFNTYIPSEALNAQAEGNAIIPFIQSITHWQIGTSLRYSISKHFFVEGGMAFGFATKAKSEYPIVSANVGANLDGTPNIRKSFGNNIIRAASKSLRGGIGYNLDHHLSLYAGYTHNIHPYLLSSKGKSVSERKDYIRGLNVGVKYLL